MARTFASVSLSNIVTGTVTLGSVSTFTLSAWFNYSSLAFTYNAIINLFNNNYGIWIKSTAKMAYYLSSSDLLDPGAATITSGVWNHLALTGNFTTSSSGNAYINGTTDGATVGGSLAPSNGVIEIAGGIASSSNYFDGKIADVAMWNVQLSTAEIAALSQGARPYQIRRPSVIFWLPMDGLQSPEPDLSGNAFNGTLIGSPSFAPGPPLRPLSWRPQQIIPVSAAAPKTCTLPLMGAGAC
jgi:hypothetical protein